MTQSPRLKGFFDAFIGPAWVVMKVAQMLLGLALAIGLIMKYYLLVFGALSCVPDDPTLANLIRCQPAMEMTAQFLLSATAAAHVYLRSQKSAAD